MALKLTRVDTWAATIEDRPGGLAGKLAALAAAGANLEMVIARRRPDRPGQGVAYVTPIKGAKQTRAAADAGFARAEALHSLRAEGADRPGLGAKITQALAEAGINLRGLSAAAIGRKCVVYLAFDTAEDAAQAAGVLKKVK
ncbi:MAG: ACT domain-containing protein [Planctomycetes bacterium]|nr:ACT domain-containing protein [Planctomycetota bacterium]